MNPLKILPTVFIIMALCSCSKYQYIYLGSNLKKDNERKFTDENDTFCLKYSFQGHNCPITLNIKNKLDKPLYINWKSSAVILDNQSLTLWDYIKTSDSYTVEKNNKTDSLKLNQKIQPEYSDLPVAETSFIPPKSSTSFYLLDLTSKFFELLPQDSMVKVNYSTANGLTSVKRYIFRKETTPFRFIIYLTLSTHQTFNQPLVADDTFWISDIVATLSQLTPDGGDQFYMEETTGMGNFLAFTGGLALITALVILDDGTTPAE